MAFEIWQIRVQGHLGAQWKDWFEGMTITNVEQFVAVANPLEHERSRSSECFRHTTSCASAVTASPGQPFVYWVKRT